MRPALILLALVACSSTSPPVAPKGPEGGGTPAPASWVGLTVGQVLSQCGTVAGEMEMVDEPPGKLRAVEFDCHQSDPARRVILEFEYHEGLFSSERSWSNELVTAQRVTRVPESLGW
ncbi:hypothetical protein [Nannocystis punicea]|uniref:Lipoprotein n=1 Tax=Nannocystis punicea TaxID=2995304 RepID=A0ABY7H7D0_9BACT|nr:hypothetical protein [Nannocystis poenicansa]WAS95000.1 hypothetical protein O0S08_02460 [Nannocystis poenicansa]